MARQAGSPARGAGNAAAAARVLLVEDEAGIVDFVSRGLTAEGFKVEAALDGIEGGRRALAEPFDAIVLDLMLPGRSGLDVLASIRETKPQVPVIVLTARGATSDRIAGLDAGAADYLLKPFSVAELAARLRAQLRQAARGETAALSGADVEVNLLTRDVRRAGVTVHLSATEFELLAYLLRRRGDVCSRGEILSAVWGYQHDPETNIVDVYIGYLRRKLARTGSPAPIATVRSVGYRFVE
jgi:DNA-binding response OmpR family regulator